MRNSFVLIILISLFGCSQSENKSVDGQDAVSRKDSVKRAMQENLPPQSEISQFNWFYSGFAQAAITGNDSVFNVVIHPVHGLWVIYSEGAMPHFINVKKISEFKNSNGKGLLPFNRDAMMSVPKEEALPVVDCGNKTFYSKTGCFTQVQNLFEQDQIWKHAGMDAADDKEISQLASTITRTVVNTANYKFYFSLIDGSWYLTFIDVRKPCEA